MTCNDDSTHTCGGVNAVDVYQAVNFVPPVLPPVVVPTAPTPPGKLTGNADFTCTSLFLLLCSTPSPPYPIATFPFHPSSSSSLVLDSRDAD
jgi:hypothetical protein